MSSERRQIIQSSQKKETASGHRPSVWQDPVKKSIFGQEKTRAQVMEELKADPEVFREFEKLSSRLQEELVEFSMGVRGLNVTYDPVFKKIFDPQSRPERLEEFLSLCMKQKVKILRVIPGESQRLTEEGSLLIMDILVKLASGVLVNVEIQRLGYLFPGARCACYSSDLLMRQYSQVRETMRKKNREFSYRDIKGVYTIVLVQKSTREFREYPGDYLHYFHQTSNTGMKLDLLQEYLLIPLDIFQKCLQNRGKDAGNSRETGSVSLKNKLEAWLTFIASDRPEDILEVVKAYPEFRELYKEVFDALACRKAASDRFSAFRYQRKELISMYSKALSILDANTVELMVEQQKRMLEKQRRLVEKKKREVEQKKREIEQKNKEVEQKNRENQELTMKLEQEHREVERLRALLKEKKETNPAP